MMKRRIFLDTNIIIDYLSKRIPFGEAANRYLLYHREIISYVFQHYQLLRFTMC